MPVLGKYRTFDDANSVKSPLALALMKVPEAQYSVFWDLIPNRSNIRQLVYEMASRSITARKVVLGANFLTSDTQVTLDATTRVRVTSGHVLYHVTTRQRIVLDAVNTTSGVCTVRAVIQAPGQSRTQINSGQELLVLAVSEHFDQINQTSRFEDTSVIQNYIQDMTERIDFSTADLREARKWGIDRRKRLNERMRDIVKDLNSSIIYGAPLQASNGQSAMTCGFDYSVENAGNVVNAASLGTAALSDLKGIFKQQQLNGLSDGDGIVAHMGINNYYAYEAAGLATAQTQIEPGSTYNLGNAVKGMVFAGIGFIPFLPDPAITDDHVRIVATAHAGKGLYEGLGEGAIEESLRVVDEPSMSNSKVQVSTFQLKFGTIWENAAKAHFILKTGING